MRRVVMGMLVGAMALAGCESDNILVPVDGPAAPRNVDAYYYAGAVTLTWELGPGWDQEPFRVYARRVTDADYFFIAEVTNCSAGLCSYEDRNVVPGQTYEYYVASVDTNTGVETPSDHSVEVFVPQPVPPPVPGLIRSSPWTAPTTSDGMTGPGTPPTSRSTGSIWSGATGPTSSWGRPTPRASWTSWR